MTEKKETPIFTQYHIIKEQYPNTLLFFRLGDFYEMFFDDAVTASKVLDLTLTQRGGNPMCGVPYHSCESYIQKLIAQNYKVAICEQLTEPKRGQMIERDVVRVITPGTVTEENMLEKTRNNFVMCLYYGDDGLGISYCDITTGLFEAENVKSDFAKCLTDALCRVMPSEVIGNKEGCELYRSLPAQNTGSLPKINEYYEWAFRKNRCEDNLKKQFGENFINVFELQEAPNVVKSCGGLMEYLNETQKRQIKSITRIKLVKSGDYMQLDATARRNLELVETIRERKRYGSLLWLLDSTKTSMGARKLRYYFDHPLLSSKLINSRLDKVEELVKKPVIRDELIENLSHIGDIERFAGKIAYGSVMPKDLLALKNSLAYLPELKKVAEKLSSIQPLGEKIEGFEDLCELLNNAISPDAPFLLRDGGYIKDGFNKELDELRNIKSEAKKWISALEQEEREKSGIKSLKIISNRVYGYFIEVSKKELDRVPIYYRRKQTVGNSERFITEDLKIIENKLSNADENAIKLEALIFDKLKEHLSSRVQEMLSSADVIGEIDAILSLATVASRRNYVRPQINDDIQEISIIGGRHPVVEAFLEGNSFIANDTHLSSPDDQIMIITGPNMAGKSTYMRQVALITFMAHIGSFVPAKEAKIALTDRIFTRVGASDDLAFGQSTFMVEMSEVASILANATPKSLIVLDEIGRGTSTFDGLSIAWSVVEHLSAALPAKTLFATHYHELTELEGVTKGVKNYKVLVKELDDDVVFLRKIVRGGANKSFGIEVARMAGLPKQVLTRAKQISKNLESADQALSITSIKNQEVKKDNSLVKEKVFNVIKDIDPNRLSPMMAFEILVDLTNQVKEEK